MVAVFRREGISMATQFDDDDYVDTRVAAGLCGLAVNTVRLWRADGSGRGPRYFKVGGRAVRYRVGDIREWLTTQRREPRKASTSN